MPNLNIIKLITLKVFEILTPKADIKQKLSFYYRPKFNLGTKWNQENTGHVYRTHSSLALPVAIFLTLVSVLPKSPEGIISMKPNYPMFLHLVCFISNIYKQRFLQGVEFLGYHKQQTS